MAEPSLQARGRSWLALLALAGATACNPEPSTACLTRDDCTGSQVCLGGRCVAQTIDVGSIDSGIDASSGDDAAIDVDAAIDDGGENTPDAFAADAFVQPDDVSVPSDAAVPPASGRLFVLTGDTRRILSFAIDTDGRPIPAGSLHANREGRALVAREDGRGLFMWGYDGAGSSSLQAFAITGGAASGAGYMLEIGGSSLPAGAPIALSPGDAFVYAGYVMGGGASIAQATAGEGIFALFTPFSAPIAGPPAGLAVGSGSDRLFVSIPSSDVVASHAISGSGMVGSVVSMTVACPGPSGLVTSPSAEILYVACAGSEELMVMRYAAGALFTIESHSVSGAAERLVLDRSGRWLLSYAPSSDPMVMIDLFEVMTDGGLRAAGSATVESPSAIGFDGSGSRIYVVRFDALDEYSFTGEPFTVTRRTSTALESIDGRAIATTL